MIEKQRLETLLQDKEDSIYNVMLAWYYYKESELFLIEYYNKGTLNNYARRKGNKFYYINYSIYTPSF